MRWQREIGAYWPLLAISVVLACGCRDSASSKPSTKPVQSTAAKTGTMPSDEECRQFAAKIKEAIRTGDNAALDRLIDLDAILESATGGIPGVESARRQFIREARDMARLGFSYGSMLVGALEKGGSYDLLKIVTVDGQKRVRFRILLPEGGVNYHDWTVVKEPNGNVRAIDLFSHNVGESSAKSIRRGFLIVAAEASKSVLARLTQEEHDYVKHSQDILAMGLAIRDGQYQQVLAIYSRLPALLQKDKTVLLFRMNAASQLGDEQQHFNAIVDLKRFHPNDPCMAMVSLDFYILRKEYDKALACVDQLDKAVGGDPYLNIMRAYIHSAKGDAKNAKRLAEEAVKEGPTLIDGHWMLVNLSLAEKDFDELTRLLIDYEQRFQADLTDVLKTPEYADYVKSAQYQQWLRRHEPKK
ncbi:MAG: hypothetical protein JW818_05875 [Pirellulales bacterium]|nr:hypothetical protein [Pirellulales bacterium]